MLQPLSYRGLDVHLNLSAEIIYKLNLLQEVKKKKKWKASGDIELSTPGLLDQCSNHWATKAVMFIWVVELTSVAIQKKYGDKKYFLKPPERIELSNAGLHWNHYTQTTELQKLWYSISSISWNCLQIKQ